MAMSDSEDIAPQCGKSGLDISDHETEALSTKLSEPDGNTLKLCLTRPQ